MSRPKESSVRLAAKKEGARKEKKRSDLPSIPMKKHSQRHRVSVRKPPSMRKCSAEVPDADQESEVPFIKEQDRPPVPCLKHLSDSQKESYLSFAKSVCALGVPGLLAEWAQNIKPYMPILGRVAFDANTTKNRYKDVSCHDLTRVVLNDGKGSDYIHANYVRGDSLYNEFICTQGPMPNTVIDFWRMVAFTKSQNVVMLCEVMENDKLKCEQYWPPSKGDKLVFGDFTIENYGTKSTSPATSNAAITKAHLCLTYSSPSGTVKHHLTHHHWKNWPDRSAPRSGKGVCRILRDVRLSPRPTIVHCSAGIGRTGTLVGVEMCLMRLIRNGSLSMVEVCKRLREQRMSAIQVDLQYAYLAYVVLEYGKAMDFIQDNDDLRKFKADLDALLPSDAPHPHHGAGQAKATFHPSKEQLPLSKEPIHPSKEQVHLSKEPVHPPKEQPHLPKEPVHPLKEQLHLSKEQVHLSKEPGNAASPAFSASPPVPVPRNIQASLAHALASPVPSPIAVSPAVENVPKGHSPNSRRIKPYIMSRELA